MTEKLRSGPLNFQYDRFGRLRHVWAGDAHVGRLVGIEAAPEGPLRELGQLVAGPYRWDGAPSPKRMRLTHPWPEPPRAVSVPF